MTKRYRPKNAEVRMTTTVVAYTSFCDGQVTRFSSLRTSLRNSRARSNRPPAASLTLSNVVVVSATMPSTFFVLTSTGVHLCARALRGQPSPGSPTEAHGIGERERRLAGQEGIE